jgi:hypothetical protein
MGYRAEDDLGKFLRLAVRETCERIDAMMPYK